MALKSRQIFAISDSNVSIRMRPTRMRGASYGRNAWGSTRGLFVLRVVYRIDVGYRPGSDTVDLADGLFSVPDKVVRPGRHDCDAAGRQCAALARVEFVAHAHVQCAGDYGDVLYPRMPVRRDLVVRRKLE